MYDEGNIFGSVPKSSFGDIKRTRSFNRLRGLFLYKSDASESDISARYATHRAMLAAASRFDIVAGILANSIGVRPYS